MSVVNVPRKIRIQSDDFDLGVELAHLRERSGGRLGGVEGEVDAECLDQDQSVLPVARPAVFRTAVDDIEGAEHVGQKKAAEEKCVGCGVRSVVVVSDHTAIERIDTTRNIDRPD